MANNSPFLFICYVCLVLAFGLLLFAAYRFGFERASKAKSERVILGREIAEQFVQMVKRRPEDRLRRGIV